MTSVNHRLIAFAFGLAVFLFAPRAQASFINAVTQDGHPVMLTPFQVEANCAAPLGESRRSVERSRLLLEFGIFTPPVDGSSGMGPGGSGSVPPVALARTQECSSGQIVTYLAAQPGLLLPIPFLDGVFRPPRA